MKHSPFRIEPESVKVAEDDPKGNSISNEACHVFHEDVARSYCANGVGHSRPHPSFVVDSTLEACEGERLAGKSTANNIDSGSGFARPPPRRGSDVIVAWYLRPVTRKDGTAKLVDFDLPGDSHASTDEAKLKSADP